MLCIDYVADYKGKGDSLQLVFNGGVLSDEEISRIKLPKEELTEYRFFDPEKIDVNFKEKLKLRISTALKAALANTALYLENPHQE